MNNWLLTGDRIKLLKQASYIFIIIIFCVLPIIFNYTLKQLVRVQYSNIYVIIFSEISTEFRDSLICTLAVGFVLTSMLSIEALFYHIKGTLSIASFIIRISYAITLILYSSCLLSFHQESLYFLFSICFFHGRNILCIFLVSQYIMLANSSMPINVHRLLFIINVLFPISVIFQLFSTFLVSSKSSQFLLLFSCVFYFLTLITILAFTIIMFYFHKILKFSDIVKEYHRNNLVFFIIISVSIMVTVISLILILTNDDSRISNYYFYVIWNYAIVLIAVYMSLAEYYNLWKDNIQTKYELEGRKVFIRYISHEIRTPLNTVFLGLQLLNDEIVQSSLHPDWEESVNEIKDSCDIAISILNDLLSHDKLQEGNLKLEKKEEFARQFIEESIHTFLIQARQKDVTLISNFEESIFFDFDDIRILIDKHKLSQVIRNLVSNALKFSPRGSTVVITTNYVFTHSNNSNRSVSSTSMFPTTGMLKLKISDSGPGISKENQRKLFKEVIQFSPGLLQNGQGSGLGLWISKGIVELHQGKIAVSSEGEGFGSTFTLELPAYIIRSTSLSEASPRGSRDDMSTSFRHDIHSPTNTITPVPSVTTNSTSRKGSNEKDQVTSSSLSSSNKPNHELNYPLHDFSVLNTNDNHLHNFSSKSHNGIRLDSFYNTDMSKTLPFHILLVDDSRMNRKLYTHLLKHHMSCISEAEDGIEAIHKIKHSLEVGEVSYDIILMDNQMPHMDGPTATKEIRQLGYDGIIIGLVSQELYHVSVDEFLTLGADRVLSKPLRIEPFLQTLEESTLITKRETSQLYQYYNRKNFPVKLNMEEIYETKDEEFTASTPFPMSPFFNDKKIITFLPSPQEIESGIDGIFRMPSNLIRMDSLDCEVESVSSKDLGSKTGELSHEVQQTQPLTVTLDNTDIISTIDNVLIVDDSLISRKLLYRLFHPRVTSLTEAEDGREATHKIKHSLEVGEVSYDIILMDNQMPHMDGPTATKEIRQLGYDGIIVGMSALDNISDSVELFLEAGADLLLVKPVNIETFDKAMREIPRERFNKLNITFVSTSMHPIRTPASTSTSTISVYLNTNMRHQSTIKKPSPMTPSSDAARITSYVLGKFSSKNNKGGTVVPITTSFSEKNNNTLISNNTNNNNNNNNNRHTHLHNLNTTTTNKNNMTHNMEVILERKRNKSDPEVRLRFRKLLLVDDSASNRKILGKLLKTKFDTISEAEDGKEAIHKIKHILEVGEVSYDIILMDNQMPHMDGPTATKEIRQLGYDGIIIGVADTATFSIESENFLVAGANRVLTKPMSMIELINTLDALRVDHRKPPKIQRINSNTSSNNSSSSHNHNINHSNNNSNNSITTDSYENNNKTFQMTLPPSTIESSFQRNIERISALAVHALTLTSSSPTNNNNNSLTYSPTEDCLLAEESPTNNNNNENIHHRHSPTRRIRNRELNKSLGSASSSILHIQQPQPGDMSKNNSTASIPTASLFRSTLPTNYTTNTSTSPTSLQKHESRSFHITPTSSTGSPSNSNYTNNNNISNNNNFSNNNNNDSSNSTTNNHRQVATPTIRPDKSIKRKIPEKNPSRRYGGNGSSTTSTASTNHHHTHSHNLDLVSSSECLQLNVLIVDDATSNRKMLSRILKPKFCYLAEAENGQEAVNIIASNKHAFDVILMDYEMPIMNGPTAVKEIRKLHFIGFIIGVTGHAMPEEIQDFISAGANKVLPKPMDAKALGVVLHGN